MPFKIHSCAPVLQNHEVWAQIPLASLEERLSRCFMFYLMQNSKYLIIIGEMVPGRLELGELGHSDRMSHCSVKFPVGTGWLGSLWKVLVWICLRCHLKFMSISCLHYLHVIQSPGAMGKWNCLHAFLTPVKADCPEADKRVWIRCQSWMNIMGLKVGLPTRKRELSF